MPDAGHGPAWVVIDGYGEQGTVSVGCRPIGVLVEIRPNTHMSVKPGLQVVVLPYAGEWFMMELSLPVLEEKDKDKAEEKTKEMVQAEGKTERSIEDMRKGGGPSAPSVA